MLLSVSIDDLTHVGWTSLPWRNNGVEKVDGVELDLWLKSADGDVVYEMWNGLSLVSMFSAMAVADETG